MPYLLRGTDSLSLMHGSLDQTDRENTRLQDNFFRPLKYGHPLTDEILSMVPNPYNVDGGGPSGKSRDVPDVFGDSLGPWHVSERVKAIIEDLEPGVHTLIPVNVLKNGSKEHVPYQYYILHTTQVIDAVIYEETDFQGGGGAENRRDSSATISFGGKCVLDQSKIRQSHLWRGGIGRYGGGGQALWAHFFASNELVKRLKAIKASGWRLQKCEVK